MGLTIKAILEGPTKADDVLEQIVDLLIPEYCLVDENDPPGRLFQKLEDYDAVVNGLASALVLFGGLDIDDLCLRVREAAKGLNYKNTTFPYDYTFKRDAASCN